MRTRTKLIFIGTLSILMILVVIGGISYSAEQLGDADSIKKILFWTSIIFLFIVQIDRELHSLIDYMADYFSVQKGKKKRVGK